MHPFYGRSPTPHSYMEPETNKAKVLNLLRNESTAAAGGSRAEQREAGSALAFAELIPPEDPRFSNNVGLEGPAMVAFWLFQSQQGENLTSRSPPCAASSLVAPCMPATRRGASHELLELPKG